MKKRIAIDLDGTLAVSKSPLDTEMTELLTRLLGIVKVAVVSGGAQPQCEKQVLAKLPHHAQLEHLPILPTCGTTSIDVTKPGIDNASGIRKLRATLGSGISDMIFVGDAIFPGGNDYPAKQAGALAICVRDPEENKRVNEAIIACLSDVPLANITEISHA